MPKQQTSKAAKQQIARRGRSAVLSKFALYELCVQKPGLLVPLLRAIHGGAPRVLAEDFCGTAAVSREWVARVKGGSAVATDVDAEPLARARSVKGITPVLGNVLRVKWPATPRPDITFVGNFSIGELHTRANLLAYLRRAYRRLARGGVFVCDTYGGKTAFTLGAVRRVHAGAGAGVRVHYTWQQRKADPLTGMVENAIHFRVERRGDIVQELTDAFVYQWRLWSVPELREAMRDTGFATTAVYAQLPDAVDGHGNAYVLPVEDAAELGETFIVCVAGRK